VSTDDRTDPSSGVDVFEEASSDTEPHPDGPSPDPAAEGGEQRGHGQSSSVVRLPMALVAVAVVLVLVSVAIAGYSTWQWQAVASLEQAREDVEVTTLQFVTTLTTWDAAEGMTATRDALREAGTERFARDVDELFGTTEDLRGLAELGARSEGEVRDVFVQSIEGDRAEAFAVVLQQATTDVVETPEVHLRYASLVLERVEGRWLVDDLELLVDTAPGGGTSAPVAPSADEAAEDEAVEDEAAEEDGS
jgi:hypothetical protein